MPYTIRVASLDAVPLPMLTRTGPTHYAVRHGTAQKSHGPVYRTALMVRLTDLVSRLLAPVWPVHHGAHFQVVTVPRQFAFIQYSVEVPHPSRGPSAVPLRPARLCRNDVGSEATEPDLATMELPFSPAAARRFGSPLQLRGPATNRNLFADGGAVLSPAKKAVITDENSGISTFSPVKTAVPVAAPTALGTRVAHSRRGHVTHSCSTVLSTLLSTLHPLPGPAAARLLNRTASVRATSSQQVLAVTSPDRARPLAHLARPARRPTPTVFVDPTEDDAVAETTPAPAPAATAVSVPPSLYDADGFVRGEDVDLTAFTEAERERLWKDAAAWCGRWAARMHSEPAKERRDRWTAALNVSKHRAELQLLARFKVSDGLELATTGPAMADDLGNAPRCGQAFVLFLAGPVRSGRWPFDVAV